MHGHKKWLYKGNTIADKPVVFIVAHKFKNPNRPEANQLTVYKVTEELNSGLPRTNPASGQGGDWSRGIRITIPTP